MSSVIRHSVGRPLDHELSEKILAETARQLVTEGYAELRIERIAQNLGCGKAAIYRRWGSKSALAAEAISEQATLGEVTDTGKVVEDLVAHALVNDQNHMPYPIAFGARHTIWAAAIQPEVRDLLWQGFMAKRRGMGRTIIQRGVARGELPEATDADSILDTIAGFALYRNTLRPATTSESQYRRLIEALVITPPIISG